MTLTPHPIDVLDQAPGTRRDLALPLYETGLGQPVLCPFVVLRGARPGPVLGVSAAVHGNELNGINIIHQLLADLDPAELTGTLLCAPVANVPAFEAGMRRFPEDEKDLNTVFPGKRDGTPSQQYARALLVTFVKPLDFLVDIHTASEGRVNSFYVRADLHSRAAREMASVIAPEIILHGRSGDGTLRNAARVLGAPAITVEAGDPSIFQGRMAEEGEAALRRLMVTLGMLPGDGAPGPVATPREPVVCSTSRWLRTRSGGILHHSFDLCEHVVKGQVLATVRDPYGADVEVLRAPADGVVIGMSRLPVAVPGTRYCHLGAVGDPPPPKRPPSGRLDEHLPAPAREA